MTWAAIRQRYPQQWLLVEAIKARTENSQRILDQLAVINTYPDSISAMNAYTELHRSVPERELYVLHTDRKELDIQERVWLGVRSA